MTRDIDLIREMMQALEANSDLKGRSMRVAEAEKFFPELKHDRDVLAYHLMLIIDQKFVLGEYEPASGRFALQRLTADGHDFIDMTRQKTVWDHARAAMKEGGGATLGLAWKVAQKVVENAIEKRIGTVAGRLFSIARANHCTQMPIPAPL